MRQPIRSAVVLAGSVALLSSCGRRDGVTAGRNGPLEGFPSFAREPADRPVIHSGLAAVPAIVADPSVIADEEGYHLFYTTLFCQRADGSYSFSFDPARPGACSLSRGKGMTAYAFSSDRGLTWQFRDTPVVTTGAATWNDGVIETPFACRVGDRLHVFYSALRGPGGNALAHRYQLGVATLELAGRSIRQALLQTNDVFVHRGEPVVTGDLAEPHGVNNAQEPSVVVRDGRLELYFVSLGLSLPDRDVGAPGQGVSLALRVALFDPDFTPLEPPSAPLLTGTKANIAEVRRFDGRYHLFLTDTELDDHEDDQIAYAVSDDGRHFAAPSTILRRRPEVAFDGWGLMAPTVALEPDRVVLFYTAWEMQEHACDARRLGMPQENRRDLARCLYPTLGRAVSARADSSPDGR